MTIDTILNYLHYSIYLGKKYWPMYSSSDIRSAKNSTTLGTEANLIVVKLQCFDVKLQSCYQQVFNQLAEYSQTYFHGNCDLSVSGINWALRDLTQESHPWNICLRLLAANTIPTPINMREDVSNSRDAIDGNLNQSPTDLANMSQFPLSYYPTILNG